MPVIRGRFGPISNNPDPAFWGPLISVSLANYSHAPVSSSDVLSSGVAALIDTGAQHCSIDADIADKLKLQPGKGRSFLQLGR
jgi:hypothetical protein